MFTDVSAVYEDNMNVVNRLQHQLDQLREKVKLLNLELNGKNSEIENVGIHFSART